MNAYVKEEELLNREEHYPVYAFYSVVSEGRFSNTIRDFSRGIGRGENFVVCLFPGDIDIPSERFDGVEVAFQIGDEVILDYATFYHYMTIACGRYLEKNPQDTEEINSSLRAYRERYGIAEQ